MENKSLLEKIYITELIKNAFPECYKYDKSENTITKLEEREKDNMRENAKSMKTLEACAYLQVHKDEYLVAKENENFTLHYDGKQFETHFKAGDNMGVNKLTLDFSTLNTEWIRIEKQYEYLFTGFVNDKLVYASQQKCLCDTIADIIVSKITYDLYNKFRDENSTDLTIFDPKVKVNYYKLHDENLNPITSIKA